MPKNPNPNPKRKINVANALRDVQRHKENISNHGGDAKKEMIPLLNTLSKYKDVFGRHGLTTLVQALQNACKDHNYGSVLRWLDNLENELRRIIKRNGDKPEQEDAATYHDDDSGHDCENCPDKKFCMACAVKQSLLHILAMEVRRELSNPISFLRAVIDADYALWLELSIVVLEENGINIIEN